MSCVIQRMASSLQHLPLNLFPIGSNSLIALRFPITFSFMNSRTYAEAPKKTTKISGSVVGGKMKEFPVETDTRRLQEYCCGSNILKDGEDVKLKPESEYPDWLFTFNTGEPKTLEELDPNSKEYWEHVRLLARRQKNTLHKFRMKVMKKF